MSARTPKPRPQQPVGVRIAGTGAAIPSRVLSNADLERLMDTSDEWIVQRTGIRERRIYDREGGETSETLGTKALLQALENAKVKPSEVDLIIAATMTADMPTPSAACLIAHHAGCGEAGAFDLNGACCGFIFTLNMAHEFIRGGQAKTVAVVGTDTITRFVDFTTFGRNAAILFGDAAGAFVLRADPDPAVGMQAQSMHADGGRGCHLYIPKRRESFYNPAEYDERAVDRIHMNGQAVFKFAVTKFPQVIEETLARAELKASDVDLYVCHQANVRILESARERFGLSHEQLPVNMERYGNTVAASVPLLFNELRAEGRVRDGSLVMFLGFGAGLTWGGSLWRV
ncbi:MAG: ketoacyl-ACP synthase III [Phycisphaerae bacterium]|nr:ketoacyl-ACP synthase III [Phycisphaerae bacterium]